MVSDRSVGHAIISSDLKCVLVVSLWEPRPNGWYEKYVTFFYDVGEGVGNYLVHGTGYGPRQDWWAEIA